MVEGVADPVEAAGDLLRLDRQRVAGAGALAVEREVEAHPARDRLGALGVLVVLRRLQIARAHPERPAGVDVVGEKEIVDLDADVRVPLAQEHARASPS